MTFPGTEVRLSGLVVPQIVLYALLEDVCGSCLFLIIKNLRPSPRPAKDVRGWPYNDTDQHPQHVSCLVLWACLMFCSPDGTTHISFMVIRTLLLQWLQGTLPIILDSLNNNNPFAKIVLVSVQSDGRHMGPGGNPGPSTTQKSHKNWFHQALEWSLDLP